MAIEAGQNLLHYRLIEKIGEGGMGVVWKAVDTTLDREVAIKMLPAAFTDDPERLARFEREAKLLASLNHANIAAVHGLHDDAGTRFLAMELVPGEDLSQRLERGALTVERVLRIGAEVAAALEAAHAQGVIHRDLKPANIVVTPEGQAKVLDFGLAKAVEPVGGGSASKSASMSPTMTSAGTVAGMILGTAGYMSPEQARGKPVDRRTDLWSLGCVLYECLAGRRLFDGETVSDSLAAILRKDPDWSALPDETPPLLRRLLRRLLTRDPSRRTQDAGDVRLELEEIIADPRAAEPAAARPASRERLAWIVAAVAVIASLAFALVGRQPAPPVRESLKLTLPRDTPAHRNAAHHAVSPDGGAVVFAARDTSDDQWRLWRRRLDSFEAEPIAGTESGRAPFWSADGTSVGYFANGKLWTIDLEEGGAPRAVAALTGFNGATWNGQDDIVFSRDESPLMHVAATGGTPKPVTKLDPEFHEISHMGPHFLPDGRRFLYLAVTFDPEQEIRVRRLYAGSLDSAEATYLGAFSSNASYVEPGLLYYVEDGTLEAVAFDAERLRVEGEPRVIGDGVGFFRPTGDAQFSVSRNGTVVFSGPRTARRLMWFDREGHRLGPVGDVGRHWRFRISPDGASVASTKWDPRTELTDIWVFGLQRDTSTRITFDGRYEGAPVWSADGSRLFYSSDATGWPNVLVTSVDSPGESEPIFVSDGDQFPTDASSDGRHLIVYGGDPAQQTGKDIWVVNLPRREGEEPLLFAGSPSDEIGGRFSPDGEWIAYVSDESGVDQIYVKEFPGPGRKVQVSTESGWSPVWGTEGRTLYYLRSVPCPHASCTLTRMMVVDLASAGALESPEPRVLFETRESFVQFDLEPGGERFLVHVRPDERALVFVVVGGGGG